MVKIKEFIQRIRFFLSANPQRTKFIGIIALALIVPLTVVAALAIQNLKQHAGGGAMVNVTDSDRNRLLSTSDPNVFVDINLNSDLNWTLPSGVSTNPFVSIAFAQTVYDECVQYSMDNGGDPSACLPLQEDQEVAPPTINTQAPACIPTYGRYTAGYNCCAGLVVSPDGFCELPAQASPTPIPTMIQPSSPAVSALPNLAATNFSAEVTCPIEKFPNRDGAEISVFSREPIISFNAILSISINGQLSKVSTGISTSNGGLVGIYHIPTPEENMAIQLQLTDFQGNLITYINPANYCELWGPRSKTPPANPPSTSAPARNILKAIYIENKDDDGSTGGSAPKRIEINSITDLQHIAWKLNDLLPSQTQAPRTVQVTLIGDTNTAQFTANISLVKSTEANKTLRSDFFKNDEIAKSIISGEDYDLNKNYLASDGRINTSSFTYKIYNAFRQLGYTIPINGLVIFRELHGLPTQSRLDQETLLSIDSELAEKEKQDKESAVNFPPLSKIIDAPSNQPPKEHLAALYLGFIDAMPPTDDINQKFFTLDEFRQSIAANVTYRHRVSGSGLGRNLGLMLNPDGSRILSQTEANDTVKNKGEFRFCASAYYYYDFQNYELADPDTTSDDKACVAHVNSDKSFSGDLVYIDLLTHEYGHQAGEKNITLPNGTTDTANMLFAKISFARQFKIGKWSWIRPNGDDAEFVSGYARDGYFGKSDSISLVPYLISAPREDFAESFTAYVLTGNIFRERAKQNVYLQQKYDFLKIYIFNGIEYDTPDLKIWEKNINASITHSIIDYFPYNIVNYFRVSDYVWDYKYPQKVFPSSSASSLLNQTPNSNYDLNGDGSVNCKDYNIALDKLDQQGSGFPADVDHNGFVDLADLNAILRNYTPGDTTVCPQ